MVIWVPFCFWMESVWLFVLGALLIADACLTGWIPWNIRQRLKNPALKTLVGWVDDIFFAMIFVYVVNLFWFQNYRIPSSSLEKSLLVGDFLFVSKLSYGPRVPNTPLSFPFAQNRMPLVGGKSYFEWPQWPYKRLRGFGEVQRNDIVVFNFPAGDTVALNRENPDYYTSVAERGHHAVWTNKGEFGEVVYRPVDRRENFVKRCVGLPGDTVQIINNQVYINGLAEKNPEYMQLDYFVETTGSPLTEEHFRLLGVSQEDRFLVNNTYPSRLLLHLGFEPQASGQFNPVYLMPLTEEKLAIARNLSSISAIRLQSDSIFRALYYPVDYPTGWTRDNYGPVWIPRKGATIELNEWNLALYHRCICNYEGNSLVQRDGKVYINGQVQNTYTFRYDYYWMMGDNRHRSADSRSWGFVPEDHIVGKPVFIWLSIDKDRSLFDGFIRWNRLYTSVQ
jgi:signal peptidase I